MILNNLLNIHEIYKIEEVSELEFNLYLENKIYSFNCQSSTIRLKWLEKIRFVINSHVTKCPLVYIYESNNYNIVVPRNQDLIKIFRDKFYVRNVAENEIENEGIFQPIEKY